MARPIFATYVPESQKCLCSHDLWDRCIHDFCSVLSDAPLSNVAELWVLWDRLENDLFSQDIKTVLFKKKLSYRLPNASPGHFWESVPVERPCHSLLWPWQPPLAFCCNLGKATAVNLCCRDLGHRQDGWHLYVGCFEFCEAPVCHCGSAHCWPMRSKHVLMVVTWII